MLVEGGGPDNFVPVNLPDDWLYLALGWGLLGLGLALGRRHHTTGAGDAAM